MNHIEKYSDRELMEMQEACSYLSKTSLRTKQLEIPRLIGDIYKIALVEINRELDERTNRKEISK